MKWLLGIIVAVLVPLGAAQAAAVYVYEDASGTRLIADHPQKGKGYKLIRQYQADDHFGLADRPVSGPLKVLTPGPSPVQSRYDDIIVAEAGKKGIEPALLKAIVHVESAFDPDAVSPKGARGLMQLMPATARRYGVEAVNDPLQSLEGGGQYMKDLLVLFEDNLELALAAYNAGEGTVFRYNGVPPYPETQNYIQKVMYMLEQYRKALNGKPAA